MAGYGGGQCNRRRVSDKAGLWHGHLPHLMSHNPFSLSVCATECHSSGPVVQLSISLKEGVGLVHPHSHHVPAVPRDSGTSAAQTELFAKFVSKGLASKIDIRMYGVSHSGQPFASHVLEKLDSELQQQQKGAFTGSRVLIS